MGAVVAVGAHARDPTQLGDLQQPLDDLVPGHLVARQADHVDRHRSFDAIQPFLVDVGHLVVRAPLTVEPLGRRYQPDRLLAWNEVCQLAGDRFRLALPFASIVPRPTARSRARSMRWIQ